MPGLFDYLNSINFEKNNLMREGIDDIRAEKEYSPWMINRGLSQHPDTLFQAQEMNGYSELDHKIQYEYLLSAIPHKKRFGKWAKGTKNEDISLISNYYKYTREHAEAALKILTNEQIKEIKNSSLCFWCKASGCYK